MKSDNDQLKPQFTTDVFVLQTNYYSQPKSDVLVFWEIVRKCIGACIYCAIFGERHLAHSTCLAHMGQTQNTL